MRRIPRPSPRRSSDPTACPHCGMTGSLALFRSIRCGREGCRFYDPVRADELAAEAADRERIAQLRRDAQSEGFTDAAFWEAGT